MNENDVARIIFSNLFPSGMCPADWDSGAILGPDNCVREQFLAAGRAVLATLPSVMDSENAINAKRYRFMRENMLFSSSRDETPTMTLRALIPAPTHDFHNDWIGERFDASVDRTIDAAIEKESRND